MNLVGGAQTMNRENYTENLGLIRNILNSQYLAVLASVEKDRPYSNLVAYAETDDLKSIFFVTDRNTRKFLNLSANENVSMLIDNRHGERPDFSKIRALTIIGAARQVKEEEKAGSAAIYLRKHPGLADFISNARSVLIKVAVGSYIIAGFDDVRRVDMQ